MGFVGRLRVRLRGLAKLRLPIPRRLLQTRYPPGTKDGLGKDGYGIADRYYSAIFERAHMGAVKNTAAGHRKLRNCPPW